MDKGNGKAMVDTISFSSVASICEMLACIFFYFQLSKGKLEGMIACLVPEHHKRIRKQGVLLDIMHIPQPTRDQ